MASIMLDLESLGFRPDTTILTLGAVKFDPYSDEEPFAPLYLRFDVDSQLELGRTTDASTIEWWGQQAAEVRDEAMSDGDRIQPIDVTKELNRYTVGIDNIWCQGPQFDLVILENFYWMLGVPIPWQHWQVRDSRTLFGLKRDLRIKDKDAHNALVDAYIQAKSVQAVYKHFGVTKNDE